MELRNRSTGAVITERQFRQEHPNVSLPKYLTVALLDSLGYDPVLEGPAATITNPYQKSIRDGVEEVNGQWFTKYVAGPVFTDPDAEAAHRQAIDDQQAAAIRAERDRYLRDTDWAVVQEQELSGRQGRSASHNKPINDYRQALRDITSQAGFPHNVVWPDKP